MSVLSTKILNRNLSVLGGIETQESVTANEGLFIGVTPGDIAARIQAVGDGSFIPLIIEAKGDAPVVVFQENDDDSGTNLIVAKVTLSPADNDGVGGVSFNYGESVAGFVEYGQIRAIAKDVTAATEDGEMQYNVIIAGTNTTAVTHGAEGISNLLPVNYAQTSQTLTGAGAVNLTTQKTLLVTTGANALTLANGVEGQEKFIVMKTDGGAGTLTPDNPKGFATLTFDDVGDSAHLVYIDGGWVFFGGTATLA